MYRLYASNSEDININNLCKKDNGTVMKGNKIENVALCYRNCINPKTSGTKYTHFSLKDNKCFCLINNEECESNKKIVKNSEIYEITEGGLIMINVIRLILKKNL